MSEINQAEVTLEIFNSHKIVKRKANKNYQMSASLVKLFMQKLRI